MSGAVLLYCAGKAVAVMQHHDAITYVLDGHSLRPTDPSLFLSLSSHCTCICKQLQLTPSLPWCHLKTTHKSAKFKPLSLFLFLYFFGGAVVCKRISVKKRRIGNRCYSTGKYTVCLQARPCIIQPGNFTGCGSEGVKHTQ